MKVSSSVIAANSLGLNLHRSVSIPICTGTHTKLRLSVPHIEHSICSKSWVSQGIVTFPRLLLSQQFHTRPPPHIPSLLPQSSFLKFWSLGAPNSSPFLIRVISPFLYHSNEEETCSDNTPNLQAHPTFVDPFCFWVFPPPILPPSGYSWP